MEKFQANCYNILTIGIDIIRFHANISSELVLSIILHLFYFVFFWKVNTEVSSLVIYFINSQLSLLA